MSFLKKLFRLPGPRELGMSNCNALQSREFTPDCDGPTWEDWHVKVKELHPIKYFFLETLKSFFLKNIWWNISVPLEKIWYYLVSHFVPSKRYHFLDLRQPYNKDGIDNYRYGWSDVPDKMLYALFNLLGEYLNKEKPHDLTLYYSKEQIEENLSLKDQYSDLEEAREIYFWWTTERKELIKKNNQLLNDWSDIRLTDRQKADSLLAQLTQQEELLENKTDEMLARLLKIRRSLWT